MRLKDITVAHFGCIESAEVAFGPGLNVLFGPNDIGKSTLLAAMRAVLLLPTSSGAAKAFMPWGRDVLPEVCLTLEVEDRTWVVRKVWSSGAGRHASLQWSNDGKSFTTEVEGRGVDGKVRELLGWGVKGPGGRSAPRGLPKSFLSTVLLGEQAQPASVFEVSLDADTDESGKAQLNDALQAMALDPLYKQVLDATQGKVAEAYTETGRRKSGRGSPFKVAAEKISAKREEYDRLREEVGKSEAVALDMQQVAQRRDELMNRRAEALALLERATLDRAKTQAHEDAMRAVQEAKAALEHIEQTRRAVETLEDQQARLEAELPALESTVDEREEDQRRARAQLEEATRRAEQIERGGDAQAQLALRELEASRDEAHRQLDTTRAALERLAAFKTRVEQVEHSQQTLARASASVAELDEQLEATRAAVARAQTEVATLERAVAHRRWLDARARREEAEQAEQAQAEAHKRAASLREWASTTREQIDDEGVPSADAIAKAHQLAHALEVARAALGGGLAVEVALESGQRGRVSIDGGKARVLGKSKPIEAEREVSLELMGVGTVHIRGGAKEARASFEAAQARFDEFVGPLLEAVGLEELAGLQEARESADERLAEAGELEHEAMMLEQKASGVQSVVDELPALREAEAKLEAALGDADSEGASEGSLDRLRGQLEDARAALERARREEQEIARSRGEVLSAVQVARARLEAAEQERTTAAAALGIDPAASIDELEAGWQAEHEAAQTTHAEAVRAIEARTAARADVAERAQVDVREAKQALAKTEHLVFEAKQRLAQATDALATHRGALGVRREQLFGLDDEAAIGALREAEQALADAPVPDQLVDAQALEEARGELEQLQLDIDEVEAEYRKLEGKMQLIGGQVVQDKADLARDALETAQREEDELRLEYEAWQLLRDTLVEAQSDEGQHLGRALSREVSQRFAELTQGRYGSLEMGPLLETKGLHDASGTGVHEVQSLSEGLKEQLATLLRISVAEHLKGALVLDDHLVQTDAARVAWFRELLRTAAGQIQIVVTTCRIEDYLDGHERPTEGEAAIELAAGSAQLRVVDLSRVIRRS